MLKCCICHIVIKQEDFVFFMCVCLSIHSYAVSLTVLLLHIHPSYMRTHPISHHSGIHLWLIQCLLLTVVCCFAFLMYMSVQSACYVCFTCVSGGIESGGTEVSNSCDHHVSALNP